jgi:DNA end-binding protein Ku
MARAMWKASLEVGPVRIPVKLYAAVEERGVHFRLLHAEDGVPVRQRMVDPRTGDEVPAEAIRKGVEVEPGRFVLLTERDLAAVAPASSRTIEVMRVVPRAAIDPAWYARPYYLGPDGRSREYVTLATALGDRNVAVARWVMRRSRHVGAIEARGPHLVLLSLRASSDVVPAERLAPIRGPEIRQAERALAEQLVAALDAPFEPAMLRDEHRERLLALVEAKAAGRGYEVQKARPPRASADLAHALKRSIAAAKEARRAAA